MEGWMLAVLGAALLYPVANTIDKYVITKKTKSSYLYVYVWTLIFTPLAFMLCAAAEPLSLPQIGSWPLILVSAVGGIGGYFLLFWALGRGDVSSLPILSTRPVLAVAMAFFMIGEWHGFSFLGFAALAFLGGFIGTWYQGASLRKIFSFSNRVFWALLVVVVFWNIADITAKPALQGMTIANFVAWRQLASLLLLACVSPLFLKGMKAKSRNIRPALPVIFLSILVQYAAFILTNVGMAHSPSIAITLLASESIFVVLIAAAISRIRPDIISEKHTAKTYAVRAVGAMLIIAAVVGIALLA